VSDDSGYSAHDLFEVCIAIGSNMVIENASVADGSKK
jgi:hypothetical protein